MPATSTLQRSPDLGQRRVGNRRQRRSARPASGLAELAAVDGHEARAEPFDAGEVLVAARLVDAPLAAPFGLERLDRHAVRDLAAVAAALADLGMDEGADRRVGPFAALAQAAALGRAGLVVEDDRDALVLAEFALRLVHRGRDGARRRPGAARRRDSGPGSSATSAIFLTPSAASSARICAGVMPPSIGWPPVIETKPL